MVKESNKEIVRLKGLLKTLKHEKGKLSSSKSPKSLAQKERMPIYLKPLD